MGTSDVAGNVKEWCWNQANGEDRYILGGAWDDPPYMFADPDAQSPLGRKSNFGVRLVRYVTEPPPKEIMAAVPYAFRDYASDQFLYSYDKKPLDPVIEATGNSDERWTRESITFAAGYGIERVRGYLYVPKHHSRFPLQTVVIFPGSYAIDVHSSKQELLDF